MQKRSCSLVVVVVGSLSEIGYSQQNLAGPGERMSERAKRELHRSQKQRADG